MAESKLSKEHQIFIVQQLAMFERPKNVQLKLKEIYGVEISQPGIVHYQITNPDLPKDWKKLFNDTRKKFLATASTVPIANKVVRLQKLQNIFDKQEDERIQNTVEMRAILEQAAKESGDAYTNKKVIDLKNVSDLSDDELLAIANSKG